MGKSKKEDPKIADINKEKDENVKPQKPKWKKVLNICLWVVLVIYVIFGATISINALIAKNNGGVGNAFGYSPMSVQSGSMRGVIDKGDLVFIKLISFDDEHNPSEPLVEKESVVTFGYTISDANNKAVNIFVTHYYMGRSKKESTDGTYKYIYEFCGMYAEDGSGETQVGPNESLGHQFVNESNIIGIYQGGKLPGFGNVTDFLTSSLGYLIMFVVPCAIFFLYCLYRLIVAIINVNKENVLVHDEQYYLDQKDKMREEIMKELEDKKKEEGDKK